MFKTEEDRANKYKKMVSLYYAVVTDLYMKFWGEHFHAASWKRKNQSIDNAIKATNERFLKDSKVKNKSKVIDIGCGIGSLSFFIAEKIGCEVTGINMSDYQLKIANKIKNKKGIENVKFLKTDIMKLDSIKDKFDIAFLIDVGCHLPDKKKAIKNIYKILNPSGTLIITDWLQKERANRFEKSTLIESFNTLWALPFMETLSSYKKMLKRNGFEIIKAKDISKSVQLTWKKFYDITIDALNKFSFKQMLSFIKNPEIIKHPRLGIKFIRQQAQANLLIKVCSDAGVLRYGYFVAKKRG